MRPALKPKIGRSVTASDRKLIVEEIVNNLRPFKHGEKFATEQATDRIRRLEVASRTKIQRRPSDLLKAHLKFRKSLLSLIEAWEHLPPLAIHTLMHFAEIDQPLVHVPVFEPKVDQDGRIIDYIEKGEPRLKWELGKPIMLQQLKRIAAAASGQTLRSLDGFSPDYSLKRIVATHAYELMCKTSKRPITGTAEGPYRTIASRMFEAVSGKSGVDSKRWCDDELKRRREHQEILRSLGLAKAH